MALNCKLDRNISFAQPSDSGGTDSCNGQSMSEGVGGIAKVVVYNISDVPSLTFENDNRADSSLVVDTINSTGQFYTIDFNSATYNEEYDNHKWTHTLTLEVPNISTLFEDILADGVNGKYLVCFLPNGAEDWRCFGWRWGAALDYSLNISPDSLGYTITLNDVSEYPLFAVDKDNFGNKNKTYTPLFKPLYDVYFCEQGQDGRHTGYLVAMYVVKVNAAGQPLDRNNRLVQWSGLKQDAYKITGITSDGGYNIIGTYQKDATFDGKPVRILDYDKCSASVTNSIFINQKKNETISLNSTITGGTYTITSSDEWSMVSDPQYVTISPVEGGNGSTPSTVFHNGVGGIDHIQFMNKVTKEIVTLDVIINIIDVADKYTFPHSTTEAVITPVVEGCSSAYTYTITPSVQSSMDDNGFVHIQFPNTNDSLDYTMTLVHSCDSNERKIVRIHRDGIDDTPNWVDETNYCEITEQGQHTGYRIYVQVDTNPYSSTYNQRRENKLTDSECAQGGGNWQPFGDPYCEIDSNGLYTGYQLIDMVDKNEKSPTYCQIRTERRYDETACPKQDPTPHWIEDDSFSAYCETMIYEPAHIEGNTGYRISRQIDDNRYSPTWGQKRDVRELSELCPAPSTEPNVEEISYSCQLETDSRGNIYMNGYADVTGLDKNVYSPTYLSSVTVAVYDEERCPPTNHYELTWDNGGIYYELIEPYTPTAFTIGVISLYNGNPQPFTVSTSCDWIGATTTSSNNVRLTLTQNTSSADRECTVTVTQNGSSKTISMKITQKSGSSPTCDCNSFSAKTADATVSSAASSTEVVVGYYTGATNCSETIAVSGVRTGTDFLTNFRFYSGTIYAKVGVTNDTTSERTTQYNVVQGSCSDYFTVKQAAGTGTSEYVFTWDDGTTASTYIQTYQPTAITLSVISTNNGVRENYTVSNSCDWLGATTTSSNNVRLTITENTETEDRECTITLTQNGSGKQMTLKVTQKAAAIIPESWTVTLELRNLTTSEEVYLRSVKVYYNGTAMSVTNSQNIHLVGGARVSLGSITFSNTAQAPEGATIEAVTAIGNHSDSSGGQTVDLTANNYTLNNGGNYEFYYNGGVVSLTSVDESSDETVADDADGVVEDDTDGEDNTENNEGTE